MVSFKKIILLLFILFCYTSFSQDVSAIKSSKKEYNELMNYIPKSIVFEIPPTKRLKKLETNFNNILTIGLYTYPLTQSKLSEDEQKWAFKKIQDLATGLFLDGKKVIVSKIGGFSGCPDKMIKSLKLKDMNITNLMFCHGCTDSYLFDYFIKIFNNKMYTLMGIKPPDFGTSKFDGEFINKKKKSNFKKLILNQDRTFKLWVAINDKKKSYTGFWENDKFILILDLSKYKEIEDLKLEYNINREKIVGLNQKKIKFKKAKKT